jgi:hypothetical protein
MRKGHIFLIILALMVLACGSTTLSIATPTSDLDLIVAQTLTAMVPTVDPNLLLTQAAATVEAALTQTAPTPAAPTTAPTVAPVEAAPDPLPASTTGVILNNGECFDFDTGQVTALNAQCDVWLAEPALFRQVNGARLSGYVTLTPPMRSQCLAGRYEPGDLSVQTDLYMCLITNEGVPGFVVVRSYRGDVPFTGIVFDYWVWR